MSIHTRFELDGEWTLSDLDYFGRSLSVSYAYFFWLTLPADYVPEHIRQRFARDMWGREYVNETFPHFLHSQVPVSEQARILSIHYNSPGWIEVAAAASALSAVALCVRAWLTNADKALDLLQKILSMLKKYGHIGQTRHVALDRETAEALTEADKLYKEAAPLLGFTPKESAKILELTGNPISALRLMAAISKSSQRLASLQQAGKLRLPKA